MLEFQCLSMAQRTSSQAQEFQQLAQSLNEDENEDPYNQPWPEPNQNNQQEVEGIMSQLSNFSNLMNYANGAMNNNNNNVHENKDQNERPGHKREFTDVLSEAIERPEIKGWLSPYLSIFTLGGGLGFAAGMSSKKMGKVVLKTTIGSLLIIQALNYKGYLTVNWDRIKSDVNRYAATKENTNYMQFLLTNIGPVLAGFGLGFHLG